MIQADEELIERTKRRAAERGISLAQLVRESLEREVGDARQPPFSIIGRYASSGPADAKADTERGAVPAVSSPSSDPPGD